MHRTLSPFPLLALLAATLVAVPVEPVPASPGKGDKTFRIAFVGPLTGPLEESAKEALDGVRIAVAYRNRVGGVGAQAWPAEVTVFDDADDPKKAALHAKAILKQKFHAVVAASTGVTVEPLTEGLRRGRIPTMVVGSARHRASVVPEDPLFFVGPWPVDQALAIADQLAIHSDKPFLGVYGDTLNPALVAEDTETGRELADAIARNLGPRQKLTGRVDVAPGETPTVESLQALRDARCDRLVLVGQPDLVDHVNARLDKMEWDVALLLTDGMLSRAAESLHDGRERKVNAMWGTAKYAYADLLPPTALDEAWKEKHGEKAPLYTRVLNGYFAADCLMEGAAASRNLTGKDAIAGIRALAYDESEWKMPIFDDAKFADLYQWYPWSHGIPMKALMEGEEIVSYTPDEPEKGPRPFPIRRKFLPTGDIGPMLRTRTPDLWDRVEINDETKIVWLTFGDEHSKQPRTIEKDMAALGLGTRGYEGDMDAWLLDELAARTLGKINKLFLKNYDGTFIPGVSYNIHFTFTKPEGLKKHKYWRGVIAGDDEAAGGRAWPGEGRVEIYSTFMYRTSKVFFAQRMDPKMSREDKQFLDGTYSWGTKKHMNERSDKLRALVDGYSSFFALTGAHEFGHVCGLGHDRESDRSIMNVVEGAGARDTQCWFIPRHAKVVEKMLGRWEPPKRRRK